MDELLNNLPGVDEIDMLSAAESVDQSTVEEMGQGYPFIQWVNGDAKQKRVGGVFFTGGFFAGEKTGFDLENLGPKWEANDLVHDDGSSTKGFTRRDLIVAPIRSRRAWIVKDGSRMGRRFPWDQYDEAVALAQSLNVGLSGRTQVLVVLQDAPDLGPVVLTLGGTVARAFNPSRSPDTVMGALKAFILDPTNKEIAKMAASKSRQAVKLPHYAFWLIVGPKREADGLPHFDTVGKEGASHQVTLPTALAIHDKMTADERRRFFVGVENLKVFEALYKEAEGWATAWDAPSEDPDKIDDSAYKTPAELVEEDIPF